MQKNVFISNVQKPEPLPMPSTLPPKKVDNTEEDENSNYKGQGDSKTFKPSPMEMPSTLPKK